MSDVQAVEVADGQNGPPQRAFQRSRTANRFQELDPPRATIRRVRILTRYLVARFLGYFAAFLIISILTIVIVEMMLNLGDMLQGDRGLPGIASYLLLRVPSYYLRDLLPVTAFAAAFFTLATAARWLELTGMKTGGLSIRRVSAPLLGVGLLLSAATFVIHETIVLDATRRWNQRDSENRPVTFRQGSFWYHRGGTIYNIDDADRTTNTLRGVRIYEVDDHGHLIRSIEAPRAVIDSPERWRFEAPLVRRFGTDVDAPPTVVRHEGEVALALEDPTGLELMSADVASLSVLELQQLIERAERDGPAPARPRALLHARLAEPLTLALFVLTAIPLGARVERTGAQGITLPALYGVGVAAVFFALRSLVDSLATNGLIPPAPAPWLLLAGFTGWAGWRYIDMPS